jgi:PAS domain S-box-containing protein
VNRGAFETIGICHENEVVGKHWLNYWQGEEAQAASRAFEAALKGGIGECVTTTQQNGTSKYWHAVINPIYDENRKVSKLLVVSRDVTEKKRAESALSESEAQFRTLADSIPQLAWTANADGFIFWYNQRWYEYTGTTPSQMEGWGWQSVHDPEFLPKVLERWKQSISTGTPFDMEFPLRRADGVYRTFLTRVQPIKNSLGQIIRWFGTNTDVEEQRRSREVLKTINEVGQKITAELDLNRLVQSVTDAATKLTGAEFGAFFYNLINDEGESYTLYTLSGAPLEAFSKFPMPRNTAIFGPTFEGTCVVRSDDIRKDPRYGKNAPYYGMPKGHLPVVSYLAVPVISRSGEVLGGLFFGHSKSGVFSSQEEDLILALSAQTAIAIDNARLFQKSKEAIQARDEFLSIASHELKTPLTPLKMQVQSLKRFIAKGALSQVAPERLHSIAETSDRQINRIATLIEDLLDVSRITSGKFSLNREEVDLVEVVREALDRYEPQITAAKCPVELRLPETLKGRWDKLRVEQVVINLLTNAIKYAPQAPITITAQVVGDQAELSVSDRGMGIAEADQKRIFDRFERVQSSKNVGGLGLGLFITRQIIETHGGRIQVSSRPNAGATFTVQLPLRARE